LFENGGETYDLATHQRLTEARTRASSRATQLQAKTLPALDEILRTQGDRADPRLAHLRQQILANDLAGASNTINGLFRGKVAAGATQRTVPAHAAKTPRARATRQLLAADTSLSALTDIRAQIRKAGLAKVAADTAESAALPARFQPLVQQRMCRKGTTGALCRLLPGNPGTETADLQRRMSRRYAESVMLYEAADRHLGGAYRSILRRQIANHAERWTELNVLLGDRPAAQEGAAVEAAAGMVKLLRHLLAIALLPFTVTVLVPVWIARRFGDGGQATAEYALVLLGAAAIALLIGIWATSGGGAGKVGDLLDAVFSSIKKNIS
jgi:hypothetical protein